jgi:16S rRNA (guanine527-N7)-methyltransferase
VNQQAQQALHNGLEELGLVDHESTMLNYIGLLQRWNRAYNLVAKIDDLGLVNRHILDCLAAKEFIHDGPCLDVGSGAGLPGLLLAVTMPATEWVLLDANGKKARFCVQAIRELGLENVSAFQERIESFRAESCYMTIISRAYSQAADFVHSTTHLLCHGGQILAMKAHITGEEEARAKATGLQLEIKSMYAPGQTGERHMMIFKK